MFKDPVLMCLNSWWPGILLEVPALLSIVRCIDVAIAGLRWGVTVSSVVCVFVEGGEVFACPSRGLLRQGLIHLERLIKPRSLVKRWSYAYV